MIIDLWTFAIVWGSLGLCGLAKWAKDIGEASLGTVLTHGISGPAFLLVVLFETADNLLLWKREAGHD